MFGLQMQCYAGIFYDIGVSVEWESYLGGQDLSTPGKPATAQSKEGSDRTWRAREIADAMAGGCLDVIATAIQTMSRETSYVVSQRPLNGRQ